MVSQRSARTRADGPRVGTRRRGARRTESSAGVGGDAGAGTAHDPSARDPAGLVEDAVAACVSGSHRAFRDRVAALVDLGVADRDGPVERALGRALVDAVVVCWRRGWQPADIPRAAERLLGRPHARLLARAVVRAAAQHPPAAIPARWRVQLDHLGGPGDPANGDWSGTRAPDDSSGAGWVLGTRRRGHRADERPVVVAVRAVALLRGLPRLPLLDPLPGEVPPVEQRPAARRDEADARVLAKVAGLLAKAESTEFPDEADALTAKAQELMARHAIDRALVDEARRARDGAPARVGGRRIGVDDPYAGAKAMLLDAVASANRCRAVWSKQFGFATVFGADDDLDAVEVLYTSLLVQSARALVAASRPLDHRRDPASSAGRTRSFRQSFLVAFASRIGDRLRAAADAVADAEGARTPSLLPVLAARREAADAACAEAFPHVRTSRVSAKDVAGWRAGEQAADRAHLDRHVAVPPDTRRSLPR